MIRDCVQSTVKPLVQSITGELFDILSLGPLAWWDMTDASTITESGGLVSQVDDKSGNANHATQVTATNQPSVDGGSLSFDGSDVLESSFDLGVGGGYSLAFVSSQSASLSPGNPFPRAFRSADDKQSLFYRQNGVFEVKSISTGGQDPRPSFDYESIVAIGQKSNIIVTVSLSNVSIYLNGALQSSANRSPEGTAIESSLVKQIFSDVDGRLYEMIAIDKLLDTSEISQLSAFLEAKHSI